MRRLPRFVVQEQSSHRPPPTGSPPGLLALPTFDCLIGRMEIIELSGYTFEEKQQIATIHLVPKQLSR